MATSWKSALAATAAIVISTTLSLFAADWIVAKYFKSPLESAALGAGVEWDTRSRLKVLMDARKENPNWSLAVPANTYLERPLHLDGQRILPLGGVAKAHVVGCNENGYYSTFSADEYGFNNPMGALASISEQIVFLGDSFTQGDCLRKGETIVDRVRANRPETINLGSGGNGPLFQLASVREYVQLGKVSVVVWMYYEGNDLEDLRRDRADPLLARYMDPEFSQALMAKQEQVNEAVRSMVEERTTERIQGQATVLPHLRNLVWHVRHSNRLFGDTSPREVSPADTDEILELFLAVLSMARDEVSAKGGYLLFAYLPEYYRYEGSHLSRGAALRDRVLAGVRELSIPIVDIDKEFRDHSDPVALFPFRLKGHYNPEGALVAAEALLRALGQPSDESAENVLQEDEGRLFAGNSSAPAPL